MQPPHEFRTIPARRARRLMMDAALVGLHWSGLPWGYARLRRRVQATILMYHSVPGPEAAPWIDPANAMAPEVFARQMEFLARRRRVISLSALVNELRAGAEPHSGTVVITFDDGYRDTLDVAAPILASHGLPATLYLPTALVTRGETPWIDRLYTAVRWRRRNEAVLNGGPPLRFGLNGEGMSSYRVLKSVLIVSGPEQREAALGALESELDAARRPPRQTMTWDEVRTLRDRFPLFEIGVHSANHLDMTSCSPDVAADEIRRCIEETRRELGVTPLHFAFPYARSSAPVRQMVADAGLSSGVVSAPDPVVRPGCDPWALPRVMSPQSLSMLGMMTGGAYPDLPRLLFNRP